MEPRKTYKTYHFKNAVALKTARRGIMTNEGHPSVEVGSPPEFKGTPDVWCPEELLMGAVNTCLMLTFLSYAQHRQLDISAYESSAEGTVDHVDGKYRVTKITVQPTVSLNRESDIPLAGQLLNSAKEECFISNSVTATVDLSPQFKTKAGGLSN